MTAERYDGADWPAVISAGPGFYGLRLPQEYGTIVEYVGPRALNPMRQEPDEDTRPRSGSSAAERRPVRPRCVGSIPTPSAEETR